MNDEIMMDWLKPFQNELFSLQGRVQETGAILIKGHIDALNEHYSRHTFGFMQGNGTEFVTITPSIFGYDCIGDGYQSIPIDVHGRAGLVEFMTHYEAIMRAASDVWEEFDRLEIGDVQ